MEAATVFDGNDGKNLNLFASDLLIGKKVNSLLRESQKILFKASSVFPFDLFPDALTIDECKVNIIIHEFFLSEDIHGIPIEMIKDIEIESGPLFASLRIVPDGYPSHDLEIHRLRKRDAIKARRIIQGLMIVSRHGVDPASLGIPKKNILTLMESIGSTHIPE